MVTAKTVQGMVRGVDRPAPGPEHFPRSKRSPVVVIDVGANVDSSPEMLAQFAVMGEIYSRIIFTTPTLGLGCFPLARKSIRATN